MVGTISANTSNTGRFRFALDATREPVNQVFAIAASEISARNNNQVI